MTSVAVDPRSLRRSHVAILCAILVVAGALRFIHLGEPVYLLDEVWHAEVSSGRGSVHLDLPRDRVLESAPRASSLTGAPQWWTTWGYIHGWTHPPLYATALRLWRAAFGAGEAASRSLSVIASLLSIILLFDGVRQLGGSRVALWSALLLALAGSQVSYARELRNYVFAQAWALGTAAAMARIIATRELTWGRIVALGITALGAFLSHYFTAFAMAGLGVAAVVLLRGRTRWTTVATLLVAAAVFIALCLPIMLKQRRDLPGRGDIAGSESGQSWQSDDAPGHVGRAIRRFADLPMRLMVDLPRGYGPFAWAGLLLLALAAAVAIRSRSAALPFWLLWFGAVALPLLVLDLARSTKLLEFLRYPLLAGPAVCALLPLLLTRLPPPQRWIASGTLSLIALLTAAALPLAYQKLTPDVRAVAGYIDADIRPGDIVAFYPAEGADWYAGNVWLGVVHYSRTFPWPTVILSKPADDELLNQLRGHTVWLFSGSQRLAATQIIPRARPTQRQYFDSTGTVTRLVLEP